MKKFLTILVAAFVCSVTVKAQTLGTFENPDNDLIRLGDYATDGNPGWFDGAPFLNGGTPQVAANPNKSGINTSEKCIVARNKASVCGKDDNDNALWCDWWGNFFAVFTKSAIVITEQNRYLHFQVYRSIQPKDFRVVVNDDGNKGDQYSVYNGKLQADGVWENVVVDLGAKYMGQNLHHIGFILSNNWDKPRCGWGEAIYAYDNFVLSNSQLPPSVTLKDGNNLKISFENQSETDEWIHAIDLIHASNTGAIVDNPFTTSTVNPSGKVYQFNKSADASWWQGVRFDFTGLMAVGGTGNPRFLHILVKVPQSALSDPEDQSVDVQLCAKDHMGNEKTEIFSIWDDEIDEWKDLVLEINTINYLKEVTVRFDVRKDGSDNWINAPANTFYVDEIVFNNDDAPRTSIISGTPFIDAGTPVVIETSNNEISIKNQDAADVRIYNALGCLVYNAKSIRNATVNVEKGVYIVNVITSDGKIKAVKVLI